MVTESDHLSPLKQKPYHSKKKVSNYTPILTEKLLRGDEPNKPKRQNQNLSISIIRTLPSDEIAEYEEYIPNWSTIEIGYKEG